jgi:selenocysteine lyase/cysteine desulfurase
MKADDYQKISSADIHLNLGVTALAVKKNALPKGIPTVTGGGTTQLYGPDWVMWAKSPADRFEAGTPAIINCIAFAKALMIIRQLGKMHSRKKIQHSHLLVRSCIQMTGSNLAG